MPKYGNNFMFLLFGELSTQNLLWYPKLMRKQFHFRNLYKDRARMYVKTYVQAYLSQCLCSQKTGYQSKCWAIEDQLNKSHFVHAMITSLKRTGEIYTYWHMDWSPTYIVTNKKHGHKHEWQIDSSCPSWSALHPSLFHPWPLETNLYGLHHWAPRSSGCWLYLASGEPQRGVRGKEREVCVSVPFLPRMSNHCSSPTWVLPSKFK